MQLFDRTLGQWLEHWAEETPDKEYIVYSDRNLRFTWSQFCLLYTSDAADE